jgi:riboflavin kinase / FMN adenylyltransferase
MSFETTVFRSLDEARNRFGPCALAIGNFDGVHIGHQELIGETVRSARTKGILPAVLTFDPHPTAVVAPERVPLLICSLAERLSLIAKAGAQKVFVLRFTTDIARLSPEEFVRQILVDALGTKSVLVGENFRFGFKQAGTPETLRELGGALGFDAQFLQPVTFRGRVISSTEVRTELAADRVVDGARLLGRCFSLTGPVVSGRGIGSKQTVPTLNLKPGSEMLVPRGIFVSETIEVGRERRWPSVTSCGHNPTFGATDLTVETYLLTPLEEPAPEAIKVRLRHFLRAEEVYPDATTLKVQILKDVARAQAYWRHFQNLRKAAPSLY